MIIQGHSLWKAKTNFVSGVAFNLNNWELFETHDYATYNPVHTAIEYINRLVSVLLGFTALGMLLTSFTYWKSKKTIPLLSVLVVLLIGFEAWLGRLVVDSVLAPRIISLHLFAGYALIFITSMILGQFSASTNILFSKKGKWFFTIAFVLLLIQLLLGTQLREVFDDLHQSDAVDRSQWIDIANIKFLIHRSFSLVYALFLILAAIQFNKHKYAIDRLRKSAVLMGCMVVLEVISGVIMEHLNIPRFAQPLHVLVSSVLFAAHSYTCVIIFRNNAS